MKSLHFRCCCFVIFHCFVDSTSNHYFGINKIHETSQKFSLKRVHNINRNNIKIVLRPETWQS